MYYIEKVDAPHVFPMAGPPMFLRDDLFDFNGMGRNGESIFTDQKHTTGSSSSPGRSSRSTAVR
ncbi:unnamed protein product [Penicillium discolor]